jgi:hypothetical protein
MMKANNNNNGLAAKLDQMSLVHHFSIMPRPSGRGFCQAAWCIDGIAYLMDNAALCRTAIRSDAWIMELSELKTTWQLACTPRVCDAQGRTKLSLDVSLRLSKRLSKAKILIALGLLDKQGTEHIWQTFEVGGVVRKFLPNLGMCCQIS